MPFMKPFDPPPTVLGRHRVLSPTASVRVSPLCLGSMNFGQSWSDVLGECDQKTSEEILDHFYTAGGNFIDTANLYQDGQSEAWLGEWMASRGNRQELVIATKYTGNFSRANSNAQLRSNYGGNSAKSLRDSVDFSLNNLKTDYIDILYVHWWDFTTSIPELMGSLNQLVLAGKVLYLGVSDTPAWFVTRANEYARNHGMRPFVVYQGKWSAANRDFEREILPMVKYEGMALAPWGTLGAGQFKTKEQREQPGRTGRAPTEKDAQVSCVLEKIAIRKGTILTSIALAYILHKAPYVFPIVGGRKIEHLKGNIEALSLKLTPEEIQEIEGAATFDMGFPLNFVYGDQLPEHPSIVRVLENGSHYDYVPEPKPIELL